MATITEGWYRNSEGTGERWWDGQRWTEHVRDGRGKAVQPEVRGSGSERIDQIVGRLGAQPRAFWFAVLGLGLVILGSFGPWVRAFIVTVSGTEGDGVYFIIGAVLALASLWAYASTGKRAALVWPILLGVGVAVYSGWIIYEIENAAQAQLFGEEFEVAETLWGLYATLIGGVVVAGHCLYLAFRGSRASAPRADAQTAELPPSAPESAEEVPRGRSRSRGVLIAGGVVLLLIALAGAGSAAALMLRDSNKTEVAPDGPSEPVAVTSEPASGVESTDRGTTTSPSPVEHVEYKTYVPSDEGYYYAAQIPSGPDWSDPSESFPTGGALLRTTVNGPNGSTLVIDRTPYEVPQLGGSYESTRTVPHPTFGNATEYVFSASESLPECNGQTCVDYLVEDGQGGGWGVLASGPDFSGGKQIARKVMESVSLADV